MADGLLLLQAAADTSHAYRDFPLIGARAAVWIAAEVHLMFAAFVLGVPMFAVVTEAIGIFGRDERYDRLSKEFTRRLRGASASSRFLDARTAEERAHYDWMGYVGNFIAISALIVLPFAGYWLGREIYQYDQSMGITMMGGFMSWLWVIQAFLIAVLFLTGNYYLWIGMGRIPGAERFRPYTKYLLIVLVLGAIVWGTPHTMIADSKELAAMGGSHHPFLGALGVMSAKNTAVNLMILTTFLSFLLYRRANTRPVVPWARTGTIIQGAMFAVAAAVVLFYGIRGYFVEAIVRIGFSVYQVLAVLSCIVFVTVIDILMARGAQSLGAIRWGKMPPRSQYALFILAVTFTWLLGLMGFGRRAVRHYEPVCAVLQVTIKAAAPPATDLARARPIY